MYFLGNSIPLLNPGKSCNYLNNYCLETERAPFLPDGYNSSLPSFSALSFQPRVKKNIAPGTKRARRFVPF